MTAVQPVAVTIFGSAPFSSSSFATSGDRTYISGVAPEDTRVYVGTALHG